MLRCAADLFLKRETFQANVVEKVKTEILFSITIFRKLRSLFDNVGQTVHSDKRYIRTNGTFGQTVHSDKRYIRTNRR
jgi:hypothetical protein